MSDRWLETVPVLRRFAQVADSTRFAPLPDDWIIGVSDVVDSTGAIAAGRYKAVNLVGAAAISAVSNALGGRLPMFVFGGDGARLAVAADQAPAAADALARVAGWAGRELDLELRVGMTPVAAIRAAGLDARAAFWQAAEHVRYAMFSGGGLEWAEAQLKSGAIGLVPAPAGEEPDLTGLSCQWGPILPRQGKILSMIVKQARGASGERFVEIASRIVTVIDDAAGANPVPASGPEVRWPATAIDLQASLPRRGLPRWRRRLDVLARAALAWLVFRLGIPVGRFDPARYRREIATNADFRKFDDGLMMTVDCTPATAERLRELLDEAAAEGIVRYGLHMQDAALMTCFVPSILSPGHIHFVDGAGGGYASAARRLQD